MDISNAIKIENPLNEEVNLEFNDEEYAQRYAAESSLNGFSNCSFSMNVCGLCGVIGKLFIKVEENEELILNIKKYMPFIDMQNNFSKTVCYQCSSQINSWNGFYCNCSFVNSQLNKENLRSDKSQNNSTNLLDCEPVNKIRQSYNCLEENPTTENVSNTMNILTDCLKSLITQLKNTQSNLAGSCEITAFDNSNEDGECNSEFVGNIKPVDVIEVDFADTEDIDIDPKNKSRLKTVSQVKSHNGTLFYDEEGYAYRVNKKQAGKLYVRCAETKCPVRGSIVGNSFRYNKNTHTHPPCAIKNGKFLAPKEKIIKAGTRV